MRPNHKTLLVWVVLIGMFLSIYHLFTAPTRDDSRIDFSQFMRDVNDQPDKIRRVSIKGERFIVEYADNTKRKTVGVKPDADFLAQLNRQHVPYAIEEEDQESFWQSLIISWLPMVFLIVIFIVFMRQLQAGGGKAMAFGKSKAKLLSESQKKVTFADVAGIEEAKHDVEEIIDFLKDPKKFTRLGGRIPKGVLLMGAPGTGKTLLARAIAGEAGVPFFSISGSDFVEMFVGVGA
ncbi:MAG: AAA family ATPase, partial [Myxococcota bacterium]